MKKFSTYSLILSLILAIFATGCSANYHIRRAMKKGFSVGESADTIRISTIDSIPYVLRDSIYWEKVIVKKDTIVRYKRLEVPLTRYETKIQYKLKRDTLRMIEKVEVVKWKTERNKNKKPNLWLFIIGFGMGFLANWLMKFAKYTI